MILVRISIGRPIFFKQKRTGMHMQEFEIIKFRSMTNETDDEGNFLPDEERLTKVGRILRTTSLDELPELLSIIKGDMSVIGDGYIIGTTKKNLDFSRVVTA
jgi:lipopolysaccharide/colanic/teichoic acid biosynthesis glycosyltransferase